MTKKIKWFLVGLVVFLLSLITLYWMYWSKPTELPTNEQLMAEINGIFPEAAVSEIQDTIMVDDHHVLVPFISEQNNYGLSYWVWRKSKWSVGKIDTRGEPVIWKVHRNDPSSYYVVWNLHPKDQLQKSAFYLIRNRGFTVTDGLEYYTPKIQMKNEIPLKDQTYGVMKLPEEWVSVMESSVKVSNHSNLDELFGDIYQQQQIYIGWIPYNVSNEETIPEHSVNSNGYYIGNVGTEFVMILNKADLETPSEKGE